MPRTGPRDEHLKALIHAFLSEPFPKLRDHQPELRDLVADLTYEDSYIAGIASTYAARGRVPVEQIVLNDSIDQRLENAVPASDENCEQLEAIKSYRARMLEVAQQMSRASGVPLASESEWLSRRTRAAG
jgi:hypothetical protein